MQNQGVEHLPEFGRYWVQHPKWLKAYQGTVIPSSDTVILDKQVDRDEHDRRTVVVHRISKHLQQGTQFNPIQGDGE